LVTHDKVLLQDVEAFTQAADDFSRGAGQQFVQNFNGFAVDRPQLTKTFFQSL
jgi:hypothetical protein